MSDKRTGSGPTRREFLCQVAAIGLTSSLVPRGHATGKARESDPRLPICVFSKHLHWLDWEPMAETAAELGFDGVDLTLRNGGHVQPERVEEDLPKATAAIRKVGLSLPMVTTGIADTGTPHAESILKTLSALSIPRYRWGGFRYADSLSLPDRLAELKPRVAELVEINRNYNLCAMYHTHSGLNEIGASIWDLWLLLKDHDPRWVSANFDVAHATVEGGLGGWLHSTRLMAPFMKGMAIKDFYWAKNAKGAWRPQWCPLGQGMVDFKRCFAVLRAAHFAGPVQMHFEYSLGGAEHGARTLTIDKREVLDAFRRDLGTLRTWLREADLV